MDTENKTTLLHIAREICANAGYGDDTEVVMRVIRAVLGMEKRRATWEAKRAAGWVSPLRGRRHTEEAKAKIGAGRRGKKHTETTRERMRAAQAAYQARVREALAAREKRS